MREIEMAVKIITFKIQENGDNYTKPLMGRKHEWMTVGNGCFYHKKEDFLETKGIKTVEEARATVKKIQRAYEKDYMKPPTMRIVRVEVVMTYDVVE